MIEVSRSLYRASLLVVLAASVFTFGCSKKPKQVSAPPSAPPAPAAAQPTVSLQADPSTVEKGDSSTLSWTSTDATQLTIAPDIGTVTAQGSTKVAPPTPPPESPWPPPRRRLTKRHKTKSLLEKSAMPTSTSIKPTSVRTLAPPWPRLQITFATIRESELLSKVTATSVVPLSTILPSVIAAPVPLNSISSH